MGILIDIRELEELTHIKGYTLRKFVSQRRVPYVKVGRLVRFRVTEIEKWIERGEVKSLKGPGGGGGVPEKGGERGQPELPLGEKA